ncbi:metallophosphoesterase family protein [Georgenia yuyongxinii]
MPTRLLLLADTHWPKRARELPAEVWAAVAEADVVVHAGDWVDARLVDELADRAARLVGCWGNNDGPQVRRRLPEAARVTIAGVRLAVVHETGPARGREQRMDAMFPETDLLVFGHSHIPWDTVSPRGMRLLNPGSPTDRRRQPHRTFMTAELGAGPRAIEATIHRL